MEDTDVHFQRITEENFMAIMQMKRPEGENFVASNAYSLAQAWLYREAGDVYPFAVYHGEEPVGFMMLDEDSDDRCLVLWRILFPEEHQGKGYGTSAIQQMIQLAKDSGKYDFIILDYVPDNKIAKHVYEKLGFLPTGRIVNDGEIEMKLPLK
ncbi:MAG: GNAT family N-acetyltransferase [Butyrivibrio sp.]|nr:GNAT family N-acetyltransferase [Acetatifactor muris]MCM1559929.1 GNAT family N-acetyltransferase [Butyrivibrio sp.]